MSGLRHQHNGQQRTVYANVLRLVLKINGGKHKEIVERKCPYHGISLNMFYVKGDFIHIINS